MMLNACVLSFPKSSDVATVIVAATQVVFTAVAAFVMDRAGRKALLILSGKLHLFRNNIFTTPLFF